MASMIKDGNFQDLSVEDIEKLGEEVSKVSENGEKNANETTNESSGAETNHQITDQNKKRKERPGSSSDNDESESSCPKKRRVIWSNDMHQKFLDAIAQIGPDRAFPKKIVEVMNIPGLTRENVASHLQKYRICLRKVQEGMEKYYQGVNAATCNGKASYMSSLGTFQQHYSCSSQLGSRNFLPLSSSSHSSMYGQGTAIGNSRVRLAPPSYSSFDVSSLCTNAHNQYNPTVVNTNVRPFGNDNRNLLRSILNKKSTPPSIPADHGTRSTASTSNSTFMGLRMASDGKSLFFGGADKPEIISPRNCSIQTNDFQFGASSFPPYMSSNNGSLSQCSSLPPFPSGSIAEDYGGNSSLFCLPEHLVENSLSQLMETNIGNAPIDFIPRQEKYFGANAIELGITSSSTSGHSIGTTNLEQQNSLELLPWENIDIELVTNILSDDQTVTSTQLPPLPSPWDPSSIANVMNQDTQWDMGSGESSLAASNNISDHQNNLPPLPSEIQWNAAGSMFVPSTNYNNAIYFEEENIVPPSLYETQEAAAAAYQLSAELPASVQPFFTDQPDDYRVEGGTQNFEEGTGDTNTDLFHFGGFDDVHF